MSRSAYSLEDSIAAIATAVAPAALGIIRTSGVDCINRMGKIFSRKQALYNAAPNTTVYGHIVDGEKKIDEVVLCVYHAPKSFTGENSVEIICHGGMAVVTRVYRLLIQSGFRAAERGEFSFRAFIHGKMDLTRAEAVCEIIDAKTDYMQDCAMGRLTGNLFNEIEKIKQDVLFSRAAAAVEAEYPEDEQTTAAAFDYRRLADAHTRIQSLCAGWNAERCYREGARVVLAGRTNAGKSALFNALLKEDRAIVSDVHGTTRDWLEAEINIYGIPVLLFDIAGFRDTTDDIESAGLARGRALLDTADLILYVLDAQEPADTQDYDFLTTTKKTLILVRSKIDMLSTPVPIKDAFLAQCSVSSKTAAGLDELVNKIFSLLTHSTIQSRPEQASPAPGTERQKTALYAARDALAQALATLQAGFSSDTITPDLEAALEHLGEITGEVRPDDILGTVFSNFCVGK